MIIFSTLQSWQQVPSCLVPTPSLTPSFILPGDIKAPCVDGFDTKSKAISSKSGWTATVGSCSGAPLKDESVYPSPSASCISSTEPQKLKIDIPDSPFEPDVSQIKDQLKHILKQWQVKQYMSDEHRWKEYYKDILKLVKHLDGEK